MSIVKSFSGGNGDMFYIKHNSDNFSVIDCSINDDNLKEIIDEIKSESKNKGICRFISTHPDEDHIHGIEILNKEWKIINFYCVKNDTTKKDSTTSFDEYCKLRDDTEKAFYIYKGCSRKWMNRNSDKNDTENRRSAGINILWPDTSNSNFKDELKKVEDGESPNNISPIIQYNCGAKFMWMGDLESDFLNSVKECIDFEKVNVLFAPHHGRESGKVPKDILKKLDPDVIIIGEAPSKNINYYSGYNTITQNSAGAITFVIDDKTVDIYVNNRSYYVDFLDYLPNKDDFNFYLGSKSI